MTEQQLARTKSPIRTVALPTEHGGWGFVSEPIVLGLLVAPSGYGALLALAMLMLFLAHQPVKLLLKDMLAGRWLARTPWAGYFLAGYGGAAALLIGIVMVNVENAFLIPLGIGAPLMLAQLVFDLRSQARTLPAELVGAASLGAIAPAIAMIDGWALGAAMVLWAILLARTIPSVLYVRARLRLQRGHPAAVGAAWGVHLLALAGIGALVAWGDAPWLAGVAVVILFARMAIGLSRYRKDRRVQTIGFQELGYGFLTAVLVAIGYRV